jgi:hypothetical protein
MLSVLHQDKDSPLQLANGTPGTFQLSDDPGAKNDVEITYSMGANGRPQIDVSYRASGRMFFFPPVKEGEGLDQEGRHYLSPESYVQTSFRAELSPDGSLVLLGPPSYDFDLELDGFEKKYARPTVQQLSEAPDDSEMLQDVLKYIHDTGMQRNPVLLLRELDAYERDPSLQRADDLIRKLDKARAPGDPDQVPRSTRERIQQQRKLVSTWGDELADQTFSPQIFSREALIKVREDLSKEIGEKVLPGMIHAVENGKL